MTENKIARPIEYKSLSKGRWYEWGTINENGSYFTGPPSDPKATHCQFTGLTDCTGKKIFEGDIVKDLFVVDGLGVHPNELRTKNPIVVEIPKFYYLQEFNGWVIEQDFLIIDNVHEQGAT